MDFKNQHYTRITPICTIKRKIILKYWSLSRKHRKQTRMANYSQHRRKQKKVTKTLRNFLPFPIPEECVNLNLGSSIIARIKTETFPNDTVVHAYRSSSTEVKIKVLDQYCEKKFKCVIIQDRINSILKKIYSAVDEFSAKYEELIA